MKSNRTSLALFILTSIISLLGINGCATVDQKISLSYARQNHSIVRHSGNITTARIETKPFPKNVSGDWIIGSLNNVHGVHLADLLSDRSQGEWISDALLLELRQYGYSVFSASALPASVSRGIAISDIDVLFNINKGTISTDTRHELKFNVSVFRDGIKAKTFSVASRGDRTLALAASKEDLEKILLQSLQDTMQQVIPDIIDLIDKK